MFGDYSEILLRFVLSCFWGFPVSQAGSECSLPYPSYSQSESAHHGLGSVKQSASHSKSILRVPGHGNGHTPGILLCTFPFVL